MRNDLTKRAIATITLAVFSAATVSTSVVYAGGLPLPDPSLTPADFTIEKPKTRKCIGSDWKIKLARLIEEWQGVTYVWGGCTRQGTDCSGFVMGVYRELGVSLPHGSKYLASCQQGMIVQGEPKFGDILVFKGHAALYTGDGRTAETIAGHVGRSWLGGRCPLVVRRLVDDQGYVIGPGDPVPQPTLEEIIGKVQTYGTDVLCTMPKVAYRRDSDGATLMHWAADRGVTSALQWLHGHGGNINARKNNGVTPLQVACAKGQTEAVRALLSMGANRDLTDSEGRTATSIATDNNQQEIVAILADLSAGFKHTLKPEPAPEVIAIQPDVELISGGEPTDSPVRRDDAPQPSGPRMLGSMPSPRPTSTPIESPSSRPSRPAHLSPFQRDARRMLDLTNEERAASGITPVVLDQSLSDIATARAQIIAKSSEPVRAYQRLRSPEDDYPVAKVKFGRLHENVVCSMNATDAHMCLTKNVDQLGNMVDRGCRVVGIGVAYATTGKIYVQIFGGKVTVVSTEPDVE